MATKKKKKPKNTKKWSAAAIIRETRRILDTDAKWCKGYFAVSKSGSPVSERSACATKFCLSGAASLARWRVLGDSPQYNAMMNVDNMSAEEAKKYYKIDNNADRFLTIAANRLFRYRAECSSGFIGFNDHTKTTFSDVKKVLAEAVRIAVAKEKKRVSK